MYCELTLCHKASQSSSNYLLQFHYRDLRSHVRSKKFVLFLAGLRSKKLFYTTQGNIGERNDLVEEVEGTLYEGKDDTKGGSFCATNCCAHCVYIVIELGVLP